MFEFVLGAQRFYRGRVHESIVDNVKDFHFMMKCQRCDQNSYVNTFYGL